MSLGLWVVQQSLLGWPSIGSPRVIPVIADLLPPAFCPRTYLLSRGGEVGAGLSPVALG
jgi:hypothetical protein